MRAKLITRIFKRLCRKSGVKSVKLLKLSTCTFANDKIVVDNICKLLRGVDCKRAYHFFEMKSGADYSHCYSSYMVYSM